MIDKSLLGQIDSLQEESKEIEEYLRKLEINSNRSIIDSVSASSQEYPYVKHTVKIEGIEYESPKRKQLKNKYRSMLQNKKDDIDEKIVELEHQMNEIEDSEIRRIIRLKYINKMSWKQIMFKLNLKSESAARNKLDRFLEKNI